jgi:hypothetical protein
MSDCAADIFVSLQGLDEKQALQQASASSSSAKIELSSLELTSCSGCSRNMPPTARNADAFCVAGGRCLMCPNWYACPDCTAEQAQNHRVSHANHVTYCITRELESAAFENSTCRDPMNPFLFVAQHFFTPLFKMSLPVLAAWAQVTQQSNASQHAEALMVHRHYS